MYNRTKKNEDMNNNILKSLRQAMFCTAAAAIVSIGFTACADDTFMTQNTTAPADGYQVCIPANIGGGSTRAIAYNSESGGYDATFETTDNIFAYYKTSNSSMYSRNPINPDSDGKSANLVGQLAFEFEGTPITPNVGDELKLLYKTTYFNYSRDFNNQWDQEPDYAVATVTITAISDGKIMTSAANFQNYQSIFKINFTGIGSGVKIKKVMIQSDKNKLVSSYSVSSPNQNDQFGPVTYTYKDEGSDERELIFFLRFASNPNNQTNESGDEISFKAVGSDGHYYSGSKSVTGDLTDSKYYQAEVAMEDEGLAMTLKNNTTGEFVETSSYTQLFSKEASYTAENNGNGICLEWYGGDHELTLKNVSINNNHDVAIALKSDPGDLDNTQVHKLVLDGVNTLNVSGYSSCVNLQKGSLIISSPSSGKLVLKADYTGLSMMDDTKVTIESGEVTIDGRISMNPSTSSCVITNSGKLRILTNNNPSSGIKAGNGYVLNTATEGDYTVYSVTEAPYEDPKALGSATTADIGKIIGSDRNIHVPNWDLPEGVRPLAMITNISSTGQGFALALDRINYQDCESFTWNNSGWGNNGRTAFEIFQAWAEENKVTFGTWHLATKAEWQQMVINLRIDGDATVASDDNMVAEGLVTILKQAGIFRDGIECWTGELDTEERITAVMFDNRTWVPESPDPLYGPYQLSYTYTDANFINNHYCNLLPVLEFGQ